LARELTVSIDSKLEREMSKYPEVDWSKVIRKAIIDCIHCKEISEVYTAPIERALSQEK
jgi:hypothetical protein